MPVQSAHTHSLAQQPLGGKAQFGGQRFEKWVPGLSKPLVQATYCKRSRLLMSDDTVGRSKAYEAIVKGDPMLTPWYSRVTQRITA